MSVCWPATVELRLPRGLPAPNIRTEPRYVLLLSPVTASRGNTYILVHYGSKWKPVSIPLRMQDVSGVSRVKTCDQILTSSSASTGVTSGSHQGR